MFQKLDFRNILKTFENLITFAFYFGRDNISGLWKILVHYENA